MPKPFDPDQEAKFQRILDRLKANDEAKHGPGHFEKMVQRGTLMMTKRADELTPTERAFLDGDTDKLN